MDKKRGTPFNRPFNIEKPTDSIRRAQDDFFKRLQLLEIGRVYTPSEIESFFNFRYEEGLRELLRDFSKWKKAEGGYELVEKMPIATQESLPPYLEGFDEEYSLVTQFFSSHPYDKSYTVKEMVEYLGIDPETSVGEMRKNRIVNLLKELQYRKLLQVSGPVSPLKYQWVGKKFNNEA